MLRFLFWTIPSLIILLALFMLLRPRWVLMALQRLQGKSASSAAPDERTVNAVLVTGMITLGSGLIGLVGGLAADLVLNSSPGSRLIAGP